MRAVITGASNFVGKNLAKKMNEQGWEVISVVRRGREQESTINGSYAVGMDMEEYGLLGNAVGACDCFVHLAWNGTRGEESRDHIRQRKNVESSVAAVRSMLEAGCKKVVTVGSQAEYGRYETRISEDTPCRPEAAYGKAKLEVFQAVAGLCGKAGACHIEPRFFSLYGPGDRADTLVMSMLKHMLAGEPCELTECTQRWDFLYIQDAVDALFRLCEESGHSGVYNFGSGDSRPLRTYIEEMAQVTNTKSDLRFGAVPYPRGGSVSLWPDTRKLENELKWKPAVGFKDGISTILSSIQKGER